MSPREPSDDVATRLVGGGVVFLVATLVVGLVMGSLLVGAVAGFAAGIVALVLSADAGSAAAPPQRRATPPRGR